MKQTQSKTRRPRSLRQDQASAAPAVVKSGLALSLSTAMLVPLSAMAQQAAEPQPTQNAELPSIKVQAKAIDPNPNAEVGVPYKAKTSGDVRHTRPLAETPQTISVITKTAIDDSGFTDLKQILSAQPGITLGTGENGNAFGDRYIIRGQEARSDVFVDGLRDPGMSTRESFAIEQVEISKGPSSTFAGRGSAGGAVNAITKQATLDLDFNRVSAAVGTDNHVRLTADANKAFTDQFALRANVLYADEDVPDRAPSSRNRKGLALSGLWELNSDLSVTIDYYGLRGKDDKPDLGGYLVGTMPNRRPAKDVPVYAQNGDAITSHQDTLTARIKYRLSADTSISSLTRYGSSRNSYITTGGANGGTRYANGTLISNATTTVDSGHTGWQDVNYFAHQTNVRLDRTIAGLKNEFVVGAEYTDHRVVSGNYSLNNQTSSYNCAPTAVAANNAWCINNAADPQSVVARRTVRNNPSQKWHVRTFALSGMDTIDFTDKFSAFAGLRFDWLTLNLDRFTAATGVQTAHYNDDEALINGQLGLSYKIAPKGIIYASWGTAQDINGGEPDSGTNPGYGGYVVSANGNQKAKPEKSVNFELGTKWNLLDDKLLFTAAAFQTTKSDVMEGADYSGAGTYNTGKNRVRGVEFGLTGNVTEKLTAQAGVALMDSEILKSSPLPATQTVTAAQQAATAKANVGKRLANFANRSLSVQLKYQATDAFAFGGAVRHESQRYGGQPDTAAAYSGTTGMYNQPVPAFVVYDVFGSYRFSRRLDVRLNVLNVTDKDYYTAVYRSGNFLYKGDGRAARVTLNYEF